MSIHQEDAAQFIVEYLRAARREDHSSYGYEFYLPNVIRAYRRDVDQDNSHYAGSDQRAIDLSPVFYDAAWNLCNSGILRPGIRRMGLQATDDGSSGNGYSLTAAGREWLNASADAPFILVGPTRFSEVIARFRGRLGEGFFQRSQEAARCHFSKCYLASCAMVGAASESILLRVAIQKSGDENLILQEYRSASGRRKVENRIVGQVSGRLADQFKSHLELMIYWRDEAAHGIFSNISELEAYESLARLLRFAQLVDDNWDALTVR